jgi:DNA-binding response OmpR family regulator
MLNPMTNVPERPVLLMVEDDLILRNIADHVFATTFDATSTADARSALSYTKQRVPDVILIDIMLPDMSGFDLLKQWRADERFKDTAMIMFTNLSSDEDKKKAKDLGADGYYVKVDIEITDLPAIILKHIKKRRNPGWNWLP